MAEHDHDRTPRYAAGSLSLTGAVAMGTGVMIGAGIFALTGQLAEHAGRWFPLAFLAAAVVTAFSAHAYVRMSSAYPSAGGIAMYLEKAYGRGVVTAVCALLMYFSMVINESLVALAVAGNLEIGAIIEARDFALAEAARPAFGSYGLWFTVLLAIIATVSGVIASTFAVSRMLAMLTDMKLVPHSHFGMSGTIQRHTLVYTVVLAMLLTVFFNLSRIAALGAIFYIVMDLVVQWGVLRNVRREIDANPFILITAIALDAIVLTALIGVKWQQDPLVVIVAAAGMAAILGFETAFLRQRTGQ